MEFLFQDANALFIDGDGGKKSFKKMCAMLELLNRKFHPNYYLATKLKFQMALVGLEELQGEGEIDEKTRVCGEILGAHVNQYGSNGFYPRISCLINTYIFLPRQPLLLISFPKFGFRF